MKNTKIKYLFLVIAISQNACSALNSTPATYDRAQLQSQAEINYAKSVLEQAQALSFKNNREYCGYIGLIENRNFTHTPLKKGKKNYCRPDVTDDTDIILASFHTHGAYNANYASETPSSDDLKADIFEGLDGYISTPGGRVWYSDAQNEKVILLCDHACILSDPNYENDTEADLKSEYSLSALENLEK